MYPGPQWESPNIEKPGRFHLHRLGHRPMAGYPAGAGEGLLENGEV